MRECWRVRLGICASMRWYARVCVGMHEYIRASVCGGMRQHFLGIRGYMRENVGEYAWACASMRQYV